MKRYIIDRIEENIAYCEDEQLETIELSRESLPENAREGDVLVEEDGVFAVDDARTEARRAAVREKLRQAFGKK